MIILLYIMKSNMTELKNLLVVVVVEVVPDNCVDTYHGEQHSYLKDLLVVVVIVEVVPNDRIVIYYDVNYY